MESIRHAHPAIFEPRALPVACPVQGRNDIFRKAREMSRDLSMQISIEIRQITGVRYMDQREKDIIDRSLERAHGASPKRRAALFLMMSGRSSSLMAI